MLRITVNAKIFLPDAVFSRLGEKSDYRKNHGRAREGRSFAAASGGNRRSGSPMSKEALQAVAQQGDYCELWNRSPLALKSSPAACTAGTGRFLRRKIPFSKAKIASLQFPRPKIRRILAETGGAHEGRRQWRKQAVVSPMKQGVPQASLRAQWSDHAELRMAVAGKLAPPPPGAIMAVWTAGTGWPHRRCWRIWLGVFRCRLGWRRGCFRPF